MNDAAERNRRPANYHSSKFLYCNCPVGCKAIVVVPCQANVHLYMHLASYDEALLHDMYAC